ncbi:ATP-binding cassette domain-containing protein [Reinekea thalattae]|uniref:ATP-binding cassette domain-containing protein n=1 Tax=Reinekea thalattae TaxID=2593301 RepID=A0A5C8Z6T5_9GAMM|nr:ATP-binding cassette domain-containing protein [Reinekea thalattae]TXR53004.1 ATP-binding cassette domain-containing protein [Reinekea thalattae]
MLKVDKLTIQRDAQSFCWDFQLAEGELLAVVGQSGVGKSTLISALLGFQLPSSGDLSWHGQPLTQLSVAQRPFGVLFQQDNIFEHLSVYQNIAFGLQTHGKLNAVEKQQLLSAAERFNLSSLLKKRASDLSGGEQQRVALARVFLQNKPILLLDEPFSSLDPSLREEGMGWVQDMRKEQNSAVILVTHHLSEIEHKVSAVLHGHSADSWLFTRLC